jgi:pimeloyl-ACP methyl ester carboxylesterase
MCWFCLFALSIFAAPALAGAQPPWLTLPPAPTLGEPTQSGTAPVNGIKIWYAEFGQGPPVILLHGGLANASYWGNQVPVLAKSYRVIVMDSRGHGRSTRGELPLSYDLMASDVLALMDFLKIEKAALVGWSDGAITGLTIALHYPGRITKLFAFAANSTPAGLKDTAQSPVFNAFIARAKEEYERLSPTPGNFQSLLDGVTQMWATEPNFTAEDLANIRVPVIIADGDHDEAIKREDTEFLARAIPGAGLLIEPNVSHFALLQDPEGFNCGLTHFLARAEPQAPGNP